MNVKHYFSLLYIATPQNEHAISRPPPHNSGEHVDVNPITMRSQPRKNCGQ